MRRFFGLDDDWVRPRPGPGWWRFDLALALGLFALSAVGMELLLSGVDVSQEFLHPKWQQYLALTSASALLVFRRRHPVMVMMLLTGAHFFIAGVLVPETVVTLGSQILYFMGMFTAFAWARNRRTLLFGAGAVLALMAGWLVWAFALSNAMSRLVDAPVTGIVSPLVAAIIWTSIINLVYFFGAIVGGQAAWHKAKADDIVREQAAQLASQATQLARQAVLHERLRIARELHDVVAHHVSLIGIQAAAARRSLDTHPEAAAQALSHVEQSSRDAVAEMRALLQSLRADDEDPDERLPVPSLTQLPELLADLNEAGFDVHYDLIDPAALADTLPGATSATLFRVIQEALSNVRQHSTAQHARVVVRISDQAAEAEVTDQGLPLTNSAGSGFGHRGIHERVSALGGSAEIGPRSPRGYRVRVLLPMGARQ